MTRRWDDLRRETPSEWEGLAMRERSLLSVRYEYFQSVIFDTLHLNPHGKSILHIGGRRGLFAEVLARRGWRVTIIESSEAALAFAKKQTGQEELAIDYDRGSAEHLPYADASFDIVYCSDTLEVTKNLDGVIAEASRVLKKGGAFLYDTVHRTILSRLVYLFVFQRWSWTNIMPPHRYDQSRLVAPPNLKRIMHAHGLANQECVAFKPRSLSQLIGAVRAYKRGSINADEAGERVQMKMAKRGEKPAVTYLGFGLKQ
ncbi:class I SAM-dependent methyltransferase [Ktedonosporobacter rubrisoli]|nr:class I SAM-dependent methyltransferase [Ktedonosporobacter rubrisoli]